MWKVFGATIKRYWWLFAAFIMFLLLLDWLWETNGPNFVLALLSMMIAAGALIAALSSLELARATTRPFLTYLVKDIVLDEDKEEAHLKIVVSNTGNLPAEKPILQARQYTSADGDKLRSQIPEPARFKELLKDKEKFEAATYFPGETRNFNFFLTFEPDALKKYKESKYIAFGIMIFYQSMQRECETIRWFLDDKGQPPKARFKPIPEKDYFK